MNEKTNHNLRSDCPINAVLELMGDKWTLLIVRDILLHDRHKFGELSAMAEHVSSNILANRLKRLVACDILEMVSYQQNPLRYEYHLTSKGQDLEPLMQAMIHWGLTHVPGTGKSKGL